MKLLVFGKPTSYAETKSFNTMLERVSMSGRLVEQVDSTSRDGIARMELFDIVTTPALVVLTDDGRTISTWQYTLPTFEELSQAFGILT